MAMPLTPPTVADLSGRRRVASRTSSLLPHGYFAHSTPGTGGMQGFASHTRPRVSSSPGARQRTGNHSARQAARNRGFEPRRAELLVRASAATARSRYYAADGGRPDQPPALQPAARARA